MRRGWGFRVLSCAAKAAFVSRRGEGSRMGGGDAPPSARRLDLRSASREGGSLKPGGGKSPLDRQRRSFVAPGFVVARSAAHSAKDFEEPMFYCGIIPVLARTDEDARLTEGVTILFCCGRILVSVHPDEDARSTEVCFVVV